GSFLVFNYLLNGHQISGWTTIVTAMFFFSGLNLIALGIIGAYLARIFDEVKARPLYVVKTRLGRPLSGPSS
ncbi:MAG TPA: glycosyltransferase, partial [Accumulibacter sp.]|nr:glycosyltransferase [Accumulibacter sp.]